MSEQEKVKELVKEVGVKKESGYLYYVDKDGDVSKVKMARGRGDKGKGRPEKVAFAGVLKDPDHLYFVDRDGNISRSPLNRGVRG